MIKVQSHAGSRTQYSLSGTSRRTFLWRMALMAAGASMSTNGGISGGDVPQALVLGHDPKILSKQQWDAFVAVHDILLPSEGGGVGAREINATAFLQWVISDAELDSEQRELLKDGLVDLEELALEKWQLPFLEMRSEDRSKLIAHIETRSWGQRWLSELLFHMFEAMLGDPVYGSNVAGIGWKWLGHIPGEPKPKTGYHKVIEQLQRKTVPR